MNTADDWKRFCVNHNGFSGPTSKCPTCSPDYVEPQDGPEDTRGLSIDMLDVDRLREWARLLLVHGADISHWGSVPYVAGKMQTLATDIEKAIRDIGILRAAATKVDAVDPQGGTSNA